MITVFLPSGTMFIREHAMEMARWIMEHSITHKMVSDINEDRFGLEFIFENEEDAIAFKLKFGV